MTETPIPMREYRCEDCDGVMHLQRGVITCLACEQERTNLAMAQAMGRKLQPEQTRTVVETDEAGNMTAVEYDLRRMCECEHVHHFPEDGGRGHPFASVPATTTVETIFGTFHVCAGCKDCMVAPFPGPALPQEAYDVPLGALEVPDWHERARAVGLRDEEIRVTPLLQLQALVEWREHRGIMARKGDG